MGATEDGPDPSAGPAPPGTSDGPDGAVDALHEAERERDAAQASRDRFSFLAEVSRCLADSLDFEATLTTVAGMSLPYLDAWCIVDVLTEVGGIRRVAVLHPDEAKQDAARELHERHPPHPDDFMGAPRVIRPGRPPVLPHVAGQDAAVRRGLGKLGEALLRELGPTIDDFVRRARVDPALPLTAEMTDVEVADHLATLVTDVAHSLALFGQAGGVEGADLVDGSRIQRLIGELHGAQRHRLGWSEGQLLREAELILEVCRDAVTRVIAGDERAAEAARSALSQLLRERVRACVSGFRAAEAAAA